jgi:hypothetical protein
MVDMEIAHMVNQDVSDWVVRTKRARERRKRSATVVFQKIHKGLYISHECGMTVDHEATWHKDNGRKWILSWHEASGMGLLAPNKCSKKFDTLKEARAYANALVRR